MLEVQSISCIKNSKILLENVSSTFFPGHLYAILGRNGSGKTTFLKALSGIWQINSGKILWNNTDLSTFSRIGLSRLISLVPQQLPLPFNFSVPEYIWMGRYAHGYAKLDFHAVEEILHEINAVHLKDKLLHELSTGERQLATFARFLISETTIILLDEPTANLDYHYQKIIWPLLEQLSKRGKVILIATHDWETAKRYCHEGLFFTHGRAENICLNQ